MVWTLLQKQYKTEMKTRKKKNETPEENQYG